MLQSKNLVYFIACFSMCSAMAVQTPPGSPSKESTPPGSPPIGPRREPVQPNQKILYREAVQQRQQQEEEQQKQPPSAPYQCPIPPKKLILQGRGFGLGKKSAADEEEALKKPASPSKAKEEEEKKKE